MRALIVLSILFFCSAPLIAKKAPLVPTKVEKVDALQHQVLSMRKAQLAQAIGEINAASAALETEVLAFDKLISDKYGIDLNAKDGWNPATLEIVRHVDPPPKPVSSPAKK